MKIGILGGSFNPVHLGHIKIAQDVRAFLNLDEIWFLCAAQPPHKKDVISHVHRYNMLKLALKNYPCFFPSDIEIKKKLLFSIDTLTHLKALYGKEHEFYFLVGFDAFLEINTWKDWKRLFSVTNFVIFNRYTAQDNIRPLLKKYFSMDVKPDGDNIGYQYKDKKIYHLKVKSLNISGSEIREAAKRKTDIGAFTDREVADYIEANNLYR